MKKYQSIAQALKTKIINEIYPKNSLLPSENELVNQYAVSRSTIRQAMKSLEEEGLIQRRQGFGSTVIAQDKFLFPISGLTSFDELQNLLGMKAETCVVLFECIPVDETLAELTGFPLDAKSFHIIRQRKIENKASILDEDYLLCDYSEGLTAELAQASIYHYLENNLKLNIAYAQKEITIDLLNDRDKSYLNLPALDRHVVSVKSHVYLADNTLFQYTESRHQVDKFRFTELARRQKH